MVYEVSWRVDQGAVLNVPLKFSLMDEEGEAELTVVEAFDVMVFIRVRTVVPSLRIVLTKLDLEDSLEPGSFFVQNSRVMVKASMF